MAVAVEEPEPLPALTDGVLPVGIHPAELSEVERVFVTEAPFSEDRALLFRALELYSAVVWAAYPTARLWVNGGFVTHKEWAAPGDIDVVVVVDDPDASPQDYPSLWTLLDVSAGKPSLEVDRIQPFGGLIDGFFVNAGNPFSMAWWTAFWQRRRMPGEPDRANAKGFVEVRFA